METKKKSILDRLKKQGEQTLIFLKKRQKEIIPALIWIGVGGLLGYTLGMKGAIKMYSKNINLKVDSVY